MGCQGFIGPIPSAFLDKYPERTGAKIWSGGETPKKISNIKQGISNAEVRRVNAEGGE
jgi:hypothetical protein